MVNRRLRDIARVARKAAGALIAVAVALLLLPLAWLPAPAARTSGNAWSPERRVSVVRGAYHVHTRRSDGSGSVEDVAAAAARAGLDFVILTDHGTGTRVPDPLQYRAGVLVIDGVEISTSGGHYVALGMGPAPYPLGGDAADVVEDVARLGGIGIVAHPDSPKRALGWERWDLPVAAFEWLNADSEWRDETRFRLFSGVIHYVIRPVESVASLFARPERTLARWDALGREGRRLVALGAVDAHARIGPRGLPDDEGDEEVEDQGAALHVPSYETMFRALTIRVELPRPFSGQARDDGAALLDGIRAGRVVTVVDALASGGALEFYATRGTEMVRMGDRIAADTVPLQFRARMAAPPGSRLVLLRNGVNVAESTGLSLVHEAPPESFSAMERAAMYRVEVRAERAPGTPPVPWMLSNAILIDRDEPSTRQSRTEPPQSAEGGSADVTLVDLVMAGRAAPWQLEKDAETTADVGLRGGGADARVELSFRIGTARRATWAALAWPVRPLGEEARVRLRASASQPLRASLQLRRAHAVDDLRWQRSVYLDQTVREYVIPVSAFAPVGPAARAAKRGEADSLLLVIEGSRVGPGASGTISVGSLVVTN